MMTLLLLELYMGGKVEIEQFYFSRLLPKKSTFKRDLSSLTDVFLDNI